MSLFFKNKCYDFLMKLLVGLLVSLVAFSSFWSPVRAQSTVPAGGTGWGKFDSGLILFGSTTLRLGTSSNLFFNFNASRLSYLFGSTTGISSSYASSSEGRFGGLFVSNQADGCAEFSSGEITSTGVGCGTGSGSGSVATSSAETAGRVPFWTSTAGTPALLSGGVAGFIWDNTVGRLTATYASSTGISTSYASSTLGFFGRLFTPPLATPGGSILAVNSSGEVIATTTPTTNPAAPDTSVQFNDGGVFGGDDYFTWSKDANKLTISGTSSSFFIYPDDQEDSDPFVTQGFLLEVASTSSTSVDTFGAKINLETPTITDGNVSGGKVGIFGGDAEIGSFSDIYTLGTVCGGPFDFRMGSVSATSTGDIGVSGFRLYEDTPCATSNTLFGGTTIIGDGDAYATSSDTFVDGIIGQGMRIRGGQALDDNDEGEPAEVRIGGGSIAVTGVSTGGPLVLTAGIGDVSGTWTADQAEGSYIFEAPANNGILSFPSLGADRTFTFPDASGTLCLVGVLCDGSGTWPWDITTNFNQVANSTTTQEWFRGSPVSLSASSTAWFDQISVGSSTSSSMATSTFFGNVRVLGTIQAGPGTSYLHTNGLNVPATGFIDFGGNDTVLTHSTGNLTLSAGDRLNVTYASTTGISGDYASSSVGHVGILNIKNLANGILNISSGVVGVGSAGTDYVAGGTGANTQMTYFTGSGAIAGDAGFTYVASTDTATLSYASTTALSALFASSTALLSYNASTTNATSTQATTTNLFVSGQTRLASLTGVLIGTTGVVTADGSGLDVANGGTGAVTLTGLLQGNGTGAITGGATINNSNWSGTDLSVANGGTGLSTFGGTDTVLYTTAADTLASEAAFTYTAGTDKLTFGYGSSTAFSAGYASSTTFHSYFSSSSIATTTSATTTNFAISSIASGRIPFSSTGGNILSAASLLFDSVLGKLTATYASTTGFSSGYASSSILQGGILRASNIADGCLNIASGVIGGTGSACATGTAITSQYASSTSPGSSYLVTAVEANDVVTMSGTGQRNLSTCDNSNGPTLTLQYKLSNFAASTTVDTATDRDDGGSAGCSASVIGMFTATTTGTLAVAVSNTASDRQSLIIQRIPASLTGASATVQGSNGQMQYNNNGVFGGAATTFWDNVTSSFGVGSTTPWGKFSVLKDNGISPIFAVGTTTGPGNNLFQIFSTTTTLTTTSTLGNIIRDVGVRIGVATHNYFGFGGLLDQFVVRGRFNTEGMNHAFCDAPVGINGLSGDAATDGQMSCGAYNFAEDGTGTLTPGATTNGGYVYGRLDTAGAADGTGVWVSAPSTGFIIAATSTPVLEVTARLSTVQNATSSNYFIGFSNVATGGTAIDTLPTAGCFFTASSTQANWRAVCRTALATGTYEDTTFASSTVLTGTGGFRKFRIEMDATTARFYMMNGASGTLVKTNTIAHNLTTQTLNAGVHIARPGIVGLTAPIDFFRLRTWWADFVPAL